MLGTQDSATDIQEQLHQADSSTVEPSLYTYIARNNQSRFYWSCCFYHSWASLSDHSDCLHSDTQCKAGLQMLKSNLVS